MPKDLKCICEINHIQHYKVLSPDNTIRLKKVRATNYFFLKNKKRKVKHPLSPCILVYLPKASRLT